MVADRSGRSWRGSLLAGVAGVATSAVLGACSESAGLCTSTADCAQTEVCVESLCRSVCNADRDCDADHSCLNGACLPRRLGGDASAASDATSNDLASSDLVPSDLVSSEQVSSDRTPRDQSASDRLSPDARLHDTGVHDSWDGAPADVSLPDSNPGDIVGADSSTGACNAQRCPEGCCVGTTCVPFSVQSGVLCGDEGAACVDCKDAFEDRADQCSEGVCGCSGSAVCGADEVCAPDGCCHPLRVCPGRCCADAEYCDGAVCRPVDIDLDGYASIAAGGDDCDDHCAPCFPGSTAITAEPDGRDQDCNGVVDDVDVHMWSCGAATAVSLVPSTSCGVDCVLDHCNAHCQALLGVAGSVAYDDRYYCDDQITFECDGVSWCEEVCRYTGQPPNECGMDGEPESGQCTCGDSLVYH